MQNWQVLFLSAFIVTNVSLFVKSLIECTVKKNSYGLTRYLSPLGMFVWGDVVVLALFWIVVGGVVLLLKDWILFLLFISVFWLVRSIGETLYWFLQQFAETKRDPAHTLKGYRLVKNDSIWFMYQVMWQCLTVFSSLTTVYLFRTWLSSF